MVTGFFLPKPNILKSLALLKYLHLYNFYSLLNSFKPGFRAHLFLDTLLTTDKVIKQMKPWNVSLRYPSGLIIQWLFRMLIDNTITVEIVFPNSIVPCTLPHPPQSLWENHIYLLHYFPSLHLLPDRPSQGTALGSLLFWSVIFTHKFKGPSVSLKFLLPPF